MEILLEKSKKFAFFLFLWYNKGAIYFERMNLFMTYLFGTPKYLVSPTAPRPQYILDTDGENFTVTHCASGILHDMCSLSSISTQCKSGSEGIIQTILQSLYRGKGKNLQESLINCNAVVQISDNAVGEINKIAHRNLYMAPVRSHNKF